MSRNISAGGAIKAVNNRRNSAGGTRKIFYNIRISAGGAKEVGKRGTVHEKPGSLTIVTTVLQESMNSQLTTGATILKWRREFVFFVSLYNGKPNEDLDALRYMRLCEKVGCQTVHGQPQDWKGCASRLVPEEWGWKIRKRKCYPSRLLCHLHPLY